MPLGKGACVSLPPARPPRGGTKPTNALPRLKDEAEEREGGDLPVPPRRVARACSCPARTPALLPLELGFGSPGPSVPFGPLPWRRGGLRWGFTGSGRGRWEKNPGREKSSFFFPRGKRQGEGGILLAEAASLPSFLPVPPSCPQAPPACLPLPSHLSLALQFESPRMYAAERDGLWLCRCVLGGVLPPPARRQAASRGCCEEGLRCLPEQPHWALCLSPSPGAVPI